MPRNIENSTFNCDGDTLWREVVPIRVDRGQKPYSHSCTRSTFESICHDVDAQQGKQFSGEKIVIEGDYPYSQGQTALAFLEERGIIKASGRFRIAATNSVHLDGMTEFHAIH